MQFKEYFNSVGINDILKLIINLLVNIKIYEEELEEYLEI